MATISNIALIGAGNTKNPTIKITKAIGFGMFIAWIINTYLKII